MRRIIIILLLFSVVRATAQPSRKNTGPLVLFTVKNTPVYTDEFIYLFKKNHTRPEDASGAKVEEYIQLLVNFKLKVMEAKTRGLDTTQAFINEFETYRNELKKPYVVGKDAMEMLTRQAYQRLTEEVKASHILVTCGPDATPADTLKAFNKSLSLRQKLTGGAAFDKMASENSDDPSAKTNGGNLGYFTALQMVYPFEQAVYTMKVGELSQPVRTRFGYHLITLTDRRPARGEVEVSHIFLRSEKDNVKVKNKIFEIFDQLEGGRNWDELCKEFSDDTSTKDAGGKLRPFGVGAMPIPEFESVAFSLKEPGEISDPFQSPYGWHIVRLEKKIPLPAYSEMEASLRKRIARDDRLQVATHEILEERKKQYRFLENVATRNRLMQAVDSTLSKGSWKYKGDQALRMETLFTIDGQVARAGEAVTYLEKSQRPSNQPPIKYAGVLYDQFVDAKLNEVEHARLLAKEPGYRNLVTEYQEGMLLFTVMENEVWNKAPQDSVALRQFYEKEKSRYTAGDRVRARVFATADKSFMEEVKRKVAAGDSIRKSDLKKFKSVSPVRNYARKDSPAVDNVPWVIGNHHAEVNGIYYLVEVEGLVPPGIKSFEESRAQVISDYQDYLERKWLVQLREKYPVKINTKGRKYVINELTKDESHP